MDEHRWTTYDEPNLFQWCVMKPQLRIGPLGGISSEVLNFKVFSRILPKAHGVTRKSRTFAKPCHKYLFRKCLWTARCPKRSIACAECCRNRNFTLFHVHGVSKVESWQLFTMIQGKRQPRTLPVQAMGGKSGNVCFKTLRLHRPAQSKIRLLVPSSHCLWPSTWPGRPREVWLRASPFLNQQPSCPAFLSFGLAKGTTRFSIGSCSWCKHSLMQMCFSDVLGRERAFHLWVVHQLCIHVVSHLRISISCRSCGTVQLLRGTLCV